MNGYEIVEDFYVRCPSNINQSGITSNVTGPAHFQFKLSHPINLENNEDWFVGLHELFVPKHHYNIYNDFNRDIFTFDFVDLETRKNEVEHLEEDMKEYRNEWSGHTIAQMKRKMYEARTSETILPDKSFSVSIPSANYTCADFVKVVNYHIKNEERKVEQRGETLSQEEIFDNYHLALSLIHI